MTKVLAQIELLAKLTGDDGWETWFGLDTQPGYDHSALIRATGFSENVTEHGQIRPVLDYEAAVVVQLQHPGIVPTVRAGLDHLYWFAAELVAGESLADVVQQLRERGFPTLAVPLTLAIGVQVADALHAAHTAKNAAGWSLNAVHGGIDLDALLLTYSGEVRVREFGIGKVRRQAWLSRVGSIAPRRVGFFSPEEVRGRPADPRSDVYSLGAVLYELLTGHPPVTGHDAIRAITDGIQTPPSVYNPKVSPQLDDAVMRALSLDPSERFQNCDHFRHELLRLAPEPALALEKVPRILSQLFPGNQDRWADVHAYERRRDWNAVQVVLNRLLVPIEEEPTALRVAPEKTVGRVDEGAGYFPGTPPEVEPQPPTLQLDEPAPQGFEGDISATLPTGVGALDEPSDAEPDVSAEASGDVARTHAAYKPVPMPEPVSAPAATVVPAVAVRVGIDPVETAPIGGVPSVPAAAAVPPPAAVEPAPAALYENSEAAYQEAFLSPEEGDDDDEPFYEPFTVAELVEAPELQPREASKHAVVEIIRTANGRALDIAVLTSPWRGYSRPNTGLSARLSGEKATVKLKQPLGGWVKRGRNPREDAPQDKKLVLAVGDSAELHEGEVTYHVRVFHPPLQPTTERQIVTAEQVRLYAIAVALSLVLHGVGGLATLMTSYLGVELTVRTPDPVEVFAEGALPKDDKPIEKPKPEPMVEKPKPRRIEPKPTTDPTEAQAKIPKSVRQQLDKRLKNSSVSSGEDKAEQLISALSTPVKGDGATIKDVVTNIDAVARPGARGAAFNVTGTLGNLPEGGVNIATSAGGNRIGDIGGSVATDVGKLDKREGTGKVRGKARGVKALAKVQGTLSSGEVYEVIQRHTGQIQACYEKQLGRNPGLAGKLTFEWTVKANGTVGTVKEVNNTLGDATVSKCVSGVIKTMKFPRPKGGEVSVLFPWIFKAG